MSLDGDKDHRDRRMLGYGGATVPLRPVKLAYPRQSITPRPLALPQKPERSKAQIRLGQQDATDVSPSLAG